MHKQARLRYLNNGKFYNTQSPTDPLIRPCSHLKCCEVVLSLSCSLVLVVIVVRKVDVGGYMDS